MVLIHLENIVDLEQSYGSTVYAAKDSLDMDQQRKNPESMDIPSEDGYDDFILDQSLSPYRHNLDSSFSSNFEGQLNLSISPSSPWPANGYDNLENLPNTDIVQDCATSSSPSSPYVSSQWNDSTSSDENQKVRSVSFSCDRSPASAYLDGSVCGVPLGSKTHSEEASLSLDQSLPACFRNLDRSLSFDFENTMDTYRPYNGFDQANISSIDIHLQKEDSTHGSSYSPDMSNQRKNSILREENQKVRSMSLSYDWIISSADIDNAVFGPFSDSSAVRPRSKSIMDTQMSLTSSTNGSLCSLDDALNQNFFSGEQKVRSVSVSCSRSMSSADIDDAVFGKFSFSNEVRIRSKSYVETSPLLSESDQSTIFSSQIKYSARTVPSWKTSTATGNYSKEEKECGYCKSIGAVYHGHNKRHCLQLAKLDPCRTCGASGIDNHTQKHCPHAAKVFLQMKPGFRARLDYNIRKRASERKEELDRLQ